MKRRIYTSCQQGPKYSHVYVLLNIEPRYVQLKQFVKKLFFGSLDKKISIYHLRYLGLRSIKEYILYFILPLMLKMRNINLVWTVHNIYDHDSSNTCMNNILNHHLYKHSSSIIILHDYLKKYIPKKYHYKLYVSSYGALPPNTLSKISNIDNDIITKVKKYLLGKKYEAVIISISTARHNNSYLLSKYLSDKICMIYVDPNSSFINKLLYSDNLLYINEYVGLNFMEYLQTIPNLIGLVGHTNISVATSLFMFSSMRVPILSLDYPPNSLIVKANRIGRVLDNNEILEQEIKKIVSEYNVYCINQESFLAINTWESASMSQLKAFST
jgi:hypothetical protein